MKDREESWRDVTVVKVVSFLKNEMPSSYSKRFPYCVKIECLMFPVIEDFRHAYMDLVFFLARALVQATRSVSI